MHAEPRAHDDALSEALLRYIADSAPVLALHLDEQLRVTTANAFARRVLGDGVVGRCFGELVVAFTPAPDPGAVAAAGGDQLLSLSTAAGLPESFRFRYYVLQRGWLAMGGTDVEEMVRLRNDVLVLNRELNDLTRRLHVANAELNELNQLKNRFIGMAAHDLRKPVGVMMTYTDLILDDSGAQLPGETREFLETCRAAASGMKRLIDDFLDASAIEAGALNLDRAPVSAADIIAGVMKSVQIQARRKGVLLQADGSDPADPVTNVRRLNVDAGKIQQAVLNLACNAVEHSTAGGHVWLSACWAGSELVFTVRDEGPGIAPEDQARLFKPFVRAGTLKTAGERSTGLGLSIARLIVEAHGGHLWVESAPGHGASFCIALPERILPPEGAVA